MVVSGMTVCLISKRHWALITVSSYYCSSILFFTIPSLFIFSLTVLKEIPMLPYVQIHPLHFSVFPDLSIYLLSFATRRFHDSIPQGEAEQLYKRKQS